MRTLIFILTLSSVTCFAQQEPTPFTNPETKLHGFQDTTGMTVIAPQYIDVRPFCNGLARVRLSTRWGCIDRSGTLVIPAIYSAISSYHDSSMVAVNGRDVLLIEGTKYFCTTQIYSSVFFGRDVPFNFYNGLQSSGCEDADLALRVRGMWSQNESRLFEEIISIVCISESDCLAKFVLKLL